MKRSNLITGFNTVGSDYIHVLRYDLVTIRKWVTFWALCISPLLSAVHRTCEQCFCIEFRFLRYCRPKQIVFSGDIDI